MVGNDVVDLGDPETRPGAIHPRFDARVMTAGERERLAAADDPTRLRWMIWAAKESAYKLARRADRRVIFAHRGFATEVDGLGRGRVRREDWWCPVEVEVAGSAVHAVATATGSARWLAKLERIQPGAEASAAVRQLARAEVSRHLGVDPASVTIASDDDRVPHLRVGGRTLGHLSLSHHGRFVAFAWMPPAGTEPA